MTERLYYKDPNILEFEANIVEVGRKEDRFFTVLDKTAFYPTSGGQLYDTGRLNDISVFEVIEDNGRILHLTDQEVGKTGEAAKGKVDKQRRQINRQNHTAQHILSQVFFRLFNFVTVSVHLGEQYGAIELNTDKIDQDKLKESEILANDIVSSNLDIEILFIDDCELHNYPMRKIPERKGTIRIIKIGEFEYSACGGTHCNCTAEVGMIKITDTEMMRNHVLVKFLAGSLAVDDYVKRYDVTYKLATDMTCHYSDLIGRFEKLTEENKKQKLKIAELKRELIPILVEKIIAKSEKIKGISLVFDSIDETDKNFLNNLTSQIAGRINGIAVIYSDTKLIIGVDKKTHLSAGDLAKKINSSFDFKGGGNAVLAQIGGVDSQKTELVREFIIKTLSDEL